MFSCTETTSKMNETENLVDTEKVHKHNENKDLHLNDGQKWKVDKDMMSYIAYMKSDINNFEGSSAEDFQTLSTDLLINIDLLTANCTMKGEAHDQLHLWLVPYIEQVNKFVVLESLEDSKIAIVELKETFKVFDQFFE